MKEIRQLRDRKGNQFYPRTKAEAVSINEQTNLDDALDAKQDTLVSGVNIKTINGKSIVGSGGILIEGGGSGSDMDIDSTPTEGSANLVTSGGVYNAAAEKQNNLTVEGEVLIF